MFKKFFLSLIFVSIGLCACAKEQIITVYAPAKITTSNLNLQAGDEINFAIKNDIYVNSKLFIKKDEKVTGIITNLEPNGFQCQEATIYAENFKTTNIEGKEVKINGIIYKKGRTHWMLTQFLIFIPAFIRGGEVQIEPNDTFELLLEEKL